MSNGYKEVLQNFEDAVRQHAFKGSVSPLHHGQIEKEYEDSKRALIDKLAYREGRRLTK